jgi:predicted nucleic-acid-binding protein
VKAVDTNLVIRFLTNDDPHHAVLAEEIVEAGVFLTHSVLMETEWVLRSRYGWPREAVAASLRSLVDYERVTVDQPDLIGWAIERYEKGANLADMFHLIAARHQDAFVTFDRDLARRVDEDAPTNVELLK